MPQHSSFEGWVQLAVKEVFSLKLVFISNECEGVVLEINYHTHVVFFSSEEHTLSSDV